MATITISRGGRGLTEVHVRETLRGTSPELAAGARETYYECHPFIYFVPGSTYLKRDIDRHTEPRSGGSWFLEVQPGAQGDARAGERHHRGPQGH